MSSIRALALLTALFSFAFADTPVRRPMKVEDVHRVLEVRDPQISPEGEWVAYTLTTINKTEDKSDSDVWMVKWDGSQPLRLTTSKESESQPRWSPDGKWLAFLSSRGAKEEGGQVWLLARAGGEATQLTNIKGSVSDYAWSPDSKSLILTVSEKEDEPKKEGDKPKTPKPIVIERYDFKMDMQGYRTQKPSRLWLFQIEGKKAELLTSETFDEGSASWSPDGARVAFFSNRAAKTARYSEWQVALADAKPGSAVRVLTNSETVSASRGGKPVWSADGSTLYFLSGRERKFRAYNRLTLAGIPSAGGAPKFFGASINRSVSAPALLPDGSISVLVVDDMTEYPKRVPINGSDPKDIVRGKFVVTSQSVAAGKQALLMANDDAPAEVYAFDKGELRQLTRHNQELLKEIQLGATRELSFRTKDGAEVHGLLTLPPDYKEGQKYPLLLRIHGGPNGQDAHAFQFERHLFAANGYAVLQVNYRGSAGRDEAYQTAIFADWGNKEVVDLLAGVDHVIRLGIANPQRLGIGGWSYGGILTDYTIRQDNRFKAATSGAGSALQLSMYGSDQYIEQYDLELGFPWKSRDLWVKLSSAFFEADKIKTPTLFLGGEKDFNVPVAGSEQMYQALRANGVDTALVIYPGENHGIRKPTYVQDRLERYLAWYAQYLK